MAGSATLTTEPSMKLRLDPRMVAGSTQRVSAVVVAGRPDAAGRSHGRRCGPSIGVARLSVRRSDETGWNRGKRRPWAHALGHGRSHRRSGRFATLMDAGRRAHHAANAVSHRGCRSDVSPALGANALTVIVATSCGARLTTALPGHHVPA